MKKLLLISLALLLPLVGWNTVCADNGFYVIGGRGVKYAPVPKSGQTTSYAARDDGDLQKGVSWPSPRLINNGDGTVTDKLTGLIWTQSANLFSGTWSQALNYAATLASGSSGLTDGSQAGDWRLPNVEELQSIIDYGNAWPALPGGGATPIYGWQPGDCWTSTTDAGYTDHAWVVGIGGGSRSSDDKGNYHYAWCVRGGK